MAILFREDCPSVAFLLGFRPCVLLRSLACLRLIGVGPDPRSEIEAWKREETGDKPRDKRSLSRAASRVGVWEGKAEQELYQRVRFGGRRGETANAIAGSTRL